jgi:hypothetical protein
VRDETRRRTKGKNTIPPPRVMVDDDSKGQVLPRNIRHPVTSAEAEREQYDQRMQAVSRVLSSKGTDDDVERVTDVIDGLVHLQSPDSINGFGQSLLGTTPPARR